MPITLRNPIKTVPAGFNTNIGNGTTIFTPFEFEGYDTAVLNLSAALLDQADEATIRIFEADNEDFSDKTPIRGWENVDITELQGGGLWTFKNALYRKKRYARIEFEVDTQAIDVIFAFASVTLTKWAEPVPEENSRIFQEFN